MKFTIELSEKEAKDFVSWVKSWYEYDPLDMDDYAFRNACKVVWQLTDQLPKD